MTPAELAERMSAHVPERVTEHDCRQLDIFASDDP